MRKEHLISYTAEMIRARREGRKSVTRRLIIPQPTRVVSDCTQDAEVGDVVIYRGQLCKLEESRGKNKRDIGELTPRILKCPYGGPGDLLWIKETYCHGIEWDDCKSSEVDPLCGGNDIWYFADGERPTEGWGKKRSAMFMPKWVARDWDEIVSNRIEQLWDITDEDAIREGALFANDPSSKADWADGFAKACYRNLWDSINAKRGYSFDTNWWIRRIEFKKFEKS
jgi:hypothetical protein